MMCIFEQEMIIQSVLGEANYKRALSAVNVCTSKRSSPSSLENIASEENAAFL